GCPEPADAAIDEPGIDRGQSVVAEPEALHHARPEVLDDDIRLLDELLDDRDRFGSAQIEDDASLAAVERNEVVAELPEERGKVAGVVTLPGCLDLDDVCPEVTQQLRRE